MRLKKPPQGATINYLYILPVAFLFALFLAYKSYFLETQPSGTRSKGTASAEHPRATEPSAANPVARPVQVGSVGAMAHATSGNVEKRIDGGSDSKPVLLPMYERSVPLAGEKDMQNRYLSTVVVKTGRTSGSIRSCTGVLLAPRLVLTAGQCVCTERKAVSNPGEGQTIIDSASCGETATVATTVLNPQQEELNDMGVYNRTVQYYSGAIRPHPQLKIHLSKEGFVTAANANLAVIVLNKPVEDKFPSVRLSESDVKVGEPIIAVGYQHGQTISDGVRLVGKFRLKKASVPSSDMLLMAQAEESLFRGDVGSPCFRSLKEGFELIGVLTGESVDGIVLTSTVLHNDWLRSEIKHASGTRSTTP